MAVLNVLHFSLKTFGGERTGFMFMLYYADIKTVDKLPTRETAILVTNLVFENGAIFSKYLECPFNFV